MNIKKDRWKRRRNERKTKEKITERKIVRRLEKQKKKPTKKTKTTTTNKPSQLHCFTIQAILVTFMFVVSHLSRKFILPKTTVLLSIISHIATHPLALYLPSPQ